MSQQWLNDFKIALINEEFEKLQTLSTKIPNFASEHELIEAHALVLEALEKATIFRQESSQDLQKVKKQLHFVHTQIDDPTFSQNI